MNARSNDISSKHSTDLLDMLSSKAENMEELKNASEVDPLDVEYHVGIYNNIREIVLQLTAGGPKIKLYVNKGILEGSYAGTRQRVHISNDQLMKDLKQQYEPLL